MSKNTNNKVRLTQMQQDFANKYDLSHGLDTGEDDPTGFNLQQWALDTLGAETEQPVTHDGKDTEDNN